MARQELVDGGSVTFIGNEVHADGPEPLGRLLHLRAALVGERQGVRAAVVARATAHHQAALLDVDKGFYGGWGIVAGQLDKSEQGNKIKAVRVHLLAEVKKKGATRMDIRLSSPGLTREDLLKIKDILLRYTGKTPVYLRLQSPVHGDSLISVGRDVRVDPSDRLMNELEAVLGEKLDEFEPKWRKWVMNVVYKRG